MSGKEKVYAVKIEKTKEKIPHQNDIFLLCPDEDSFFSGAAVAGGASGACLLPLTSWREDKWVNGRKAHNKVKRHSSIVTGRSASEEAGHLLGAHGGPLRPRYGERAGALTGTIQVGKLLPSFG